MEDGGSNKASGFFLRSHQEFKEFAQVAHIFMHSVNRVCGRWPSPSEKARHIAGSVKDAGDFDTRVRRKIKDEIVAHPVAAEVSGKFRTWPAQLRGGGEPVALDAQLINELIGGLRV